MENTERNAYIALNMVPGIGAVLVRNMVETFGSAASAVGASAMGLSRVPGIGEERAELFARALGAVDVDAEQRRAADAGVRLVTFVDETDYPRLLREIHDPPLVLYVRGEAAAMDTVCVAMVGTRGPTMYGRETARRFGFQLAQAGVTIVSGLARGIDTESHQAALRAKGRTVAVIGSALDELYPRENQGLADQIAASGGVVVSEYPFGRKADRQTFPMRNRIVSGLSRAVLVVEGGVTSGTLITAHQAVEQGRAVLAVPGRIDNPVALGCHKLIKQGARLAESVDDVLEEMSTLRLPGEAGRTQKVPSPTSQVRRPMSEDVGRGRHDALHSPVQGSLFPAPATSPTLGPGTSGPGTSGPGTSGPGTSGLGTSGPGSSGLPSPQLDAAEKALLDALREAGGETDVERLLAKTGLPAYKVNAKLISLEMKRTIRQLPGRRVALER